MALFTATVGVGTANASNLAALLDASPESWNKTIVGGELQPPPSLNPFLANLADDDDADYQSWTTFAEHQKEDDDRKDGVDEVTERQRNNDSPAQAQRIRLNTSRGNDDESPAVDVLGQGPGTVPGTVTDVGPTEELNGSLSDAKVLPPLEVGDGAFGTGVIGDEAGDPFDFDFFKLEGLSAGETIVFEVVTPLPFEDLDSFVGIWGGPGPFPLLAVNDDGGPGSFDSLVVFQAPFDGDYYVSVGGFGAFVPANPFDSASPSDTGEVGSQGEYSFSVQLAQFDTDFYSFRAEEGDIFGATVFGGSSLELRAPDGTLLMGSSQDVTFAHPESSPLPGGGNASLSYVLDRDGRYTVGVRTLADYRAEFRSFRPLGDSQERETQILFLDFDGQVIDPSIFGGPPGGPTAATLSPLSAFLGGWGLAASDEDAVIDAVVASVKENLKHDIQRMDRNEDFAIEVRNSRDHADRWGQPNVSRIVIGGSVAESGIPTIGIAQSIDVGNFDAEETALVLLDALSANPGDPTFDFGVSLNQFPLAPGSTKIDLVGVAVGNITAHEAGHFFANWHTDQFNPSANIMDQGGNLPGTLGIGPDGVFGSADDVDVDFGPDVFVPREGFVGVEDTLNSISFGLWSDDADDHDDDRDDDDDDDDDDDE